VAVAALLAALAGGAAAGERPGDTYASDQQIGIYEKLGQTIPLDLTFTDSSGKEVVLRDLLKRPTILTLVYFRCPSICSPLLRELQKTIDQVELQPGKDFDLITLSFDASETTELARLNKTSLLSGMKRDFPPEAWTFMTGDPDSIETLTESVGFKFRKDDQQGFVHAGTVIFLTKEGKIVRYLGGLELLPADIKLAIYDANTGQSRSFFKRIQRLCYAYNPAGKTYVLQVDRIILVLTLSLLAIFLLYLLVKRRRSRHKPSGSPETNTAERAAR
jgi:protein SCO1/2